MNPFIQTRAGSAGEWGERRLIEAIRTWLGDASPPSPAGMGDDCAVFAPPSSGRSLVTTDPVLWGRHFDASVPPEDAAAKLLKRNLSDIAAMGGQPAVAVVSLLLPASTSVEWLERFFGGLRENSRRYGVPIAGGDLSQTDELLGACMTIVGETVGARALTRAGGSAGDALFVTGHLGGSILGHHFSFEPRLAEGEWLAARPEVNSAMDVSDGLAKDLLALVPHGCGAELFSEAIPVSADAETMAASSGRPALVHALCDGEDYELLVTVRGEADLDAFLQDWKMRFQTPLTRIGVLRERNPKTQAPLIQGLPPALADRIRGYEHLE